jgi:hypothetical protein
MKKGTSEQPRVSQLVNNFPNRYSKWSVIFGYSNEISVRIFKICHALYVPYQSCFPCLHHCSNMWQWAQNIMIIDVQSSESSCPCSPLRSRHNPRHTVPRYSQSVSLVQGQGHSSRTHGNSHSISKTFSFLCCRREDWRSWTEWQQEFPALNHILISSCERRPQNK